jgi:hypothetical protein
MWDQDSFDVVRENAADHGIGAYTRWPGLLTLTLGVVLGPIVALITQQLIYQSNMWACGRNMHATMHIVPALALAVTIGAAITAYRDWKSVGGGVEEEAATVEARTRFLSIVGMISSVFAALVIVAMWAAIFVFDPCMRA